ncbi:RelA/SpoT domain-containing protein [Aliarcobacter butzleri]|uniref:GTP pyrophosphokinase n=1 Tax=Aliarcobacter butzleri TaxID=28197 RepID=UPI00263F2E5B|nr:RelA/SpoT domain-containing protein [Aliarcobacter butzleri]MDN5079521.1 RelA/SpoT domain-containing protein [Aliarcobacter butzleri]
MTEKEFLDTYDSEKEILKAWGEFVSKKIIDTLETKGIDSSKFLKISASSRVKDSQSLLAKAFYRGKNYKDPYNDITDKVGTRFVALLEEDVRELCAIIENIDEWTYTKDRDYELERADEPFSFNYQSMHYIVKPKEIINYKNINISQKISCEIQVRTLLQHAYSELTHDRVYKVSFDPTSEVKRVVAKSMAFLETTDEYFQKVSELMLDLPIFKLYNKLKDKYSEINPNFKDASKVNIHILNAYYTFINNNDFSDKEDIFNEFDKTVKFNLGKTYLNDQPIIYFIYYMCNHHQNIFKKDWIYTVEEYKKYFTQLGISITE